MQINFYNPEDESLFHENKTVARHIKRLSGRVICRKGSAKKVFFGSLSSLDCIKKDVSLQYGKAVGVD